MRKKRSYTTGIRAEDILKEEIVTILMLVTVRIMHKEIVGDYTGKEIERKPDNMPGEGERKNEKSEPAE